MTLWCFGSINADIFYEVPHIPAPGETLAATDRRTGLGGKGTNQSVAAARAGATVRHIGAVGQDGAWAIERLATLGVESQAIQQLDAPTGHAIINVADDGENAIVIYPGANALLTIDHAKKAFATAKPAEILLMQNETSAQAEVAELAAGLGLRVVYSAAPFNVDAVRAVLPFVSILAMNEGEAQQLCQALETESQSDRFEGTLVTLGSQGAEWRPACGPAIRVPALPVTPVDTTGAGDTFTGYFAAALDQGLSITEALSRANAAAALKVTRPGTADAIPSLDEVLRFVASQ